MDFLEREMAQDMLLMEKQLTQSYTTAETEIANGALPENVAPAPRGIIGIDACPVVSRDASAGMVPDAGCRTAGD